MAKEKICGIYKITAKHNGKVYIGQSIDIYNRWRGHWKQVRNGDSDYIHNAMRKHGKDGFIYEIVERCPQDVINEREKYWIEYYDSYNNGYNLTTGGEGVKNKKLSDKEKLYYQNIAVQRGTNKPILQFDLEGNLLKEWIGAKDIYKQLGFYSSSISQCAKMKSQFRTAYGYIWLYKDYYEKNGIDINYHLETLRNNRIYQIDNKNNVVNIWENISHLPKQYKPSCIYQAIDIDNIHHKTVYGFIWIFERDYDINYDYSIFFNKDTSAKEIFQFSLEGVLIEKYPSLLIASEKTNTKISNISLCANHNQLIANGYIWLFEKDISNIEKYVLQFKNSQNPEHIKYRHICEIDNNGAIIKQYNTAKEASEELSLIPSRIHEVCRGKAKSTKGHIFKYA